MPFSADVRTRVLLWCDRHCCICKRSCGVNIEVHHITPASKGGSDEIENAIPLCFECHSCVEHYNSEHPKGNKYKPNELRARREQVFEEFTRHLVPPVLYELTQALPHGGSRRFPDIGFSIQHLGDSLPVQARVCVESENQNEDLEIPNGYYTGDKLWNLNPRFGVLGHFELPQRFVERPDPVTLRLQVSIIDQYGRQHDHLPLGHTYVQDGNYWYLEPTSRSA